MTFTNPTQDRIQHMLKHLTTIAVVGLSNRPERASYQVAKYMQEKGYRVIPVNPNVKQILGEKSYPSLLAVEQPVDIVNVFRRSDAVFPIAQEAVQIGAKVLWLQLGISHVEAATFAQNHGLEVVMDRCIKIEHAQLC